MKQEVVHRRRPGRFAGAALAAAAVAALLAGCTSSGASTAPTPGAAAPFLASSGDGTPVEGGELRVGFISGGPAESINPGITNNYGDHARALAVYERLFVQDVTDPGTPEFQIDYGPGLATDASSTPDATLWTISLREGVLWQDGTPFTADDVVWTIQNVWASEQSYFYPYAAPLIDFANVRAVDPLTVEIPLATGVAEFPSLLTLSGAAISKNGIAFEDLGTDPIGTGPFVLESFSPGERTEFVANENYWDEGKPYLDRLTFVSFDDEGARSNALLSGALDVVPNYSFSLAAANLNNDQIKILNVPSGNTHFIYVRLDEEPFTDPRLVEALRMLVDRETLVQNAFGGFATVSNDLLGVGTLNFASDLEREYDPEGARELIEEAGLEGTSIEITTAPVIAGFVEAATLFAEQARAAGLEVTVNQIDPATYFTPAAGYGELSMGQEATLAYPSLTAHYQTFFAPGALADLTKWPDTHPESATLLAQAMAETDPTAAADLWAQVQQQQFDEGGTIGMGNANEVDAVAPNIRGLLAAGSSVALNNFAFQNAWIEE